MKKIHRKRLLQLADWLDAGAPHEHVKFKMDTFFAPIDSNGMTYGFWERPAPKNIYGAVCCIGGAAAVFFAGNEVVNALTHTFSAHSLWDIGAQALGLTEDQANHLFSPAVDYSEVTPKRAGKVVRHLAYTGEIDWRVAGFPVKS